jgi:hypothetical protein
MPCREVRSPSGFLQLFFFEFGEDIDIPGEETKAGRVKHAEADFNGIRHFVDPAGLHDELEFPESGPERRKYREGILAIGIDVMGVRKPDFASCFAYVFQKTRETAQFGDFCPGEITVSRGNSIFYTHRER